MPFEKRGKSGGGWKGGGKSFGDKKPWSKGGDRGGFGGNRGFDKPEMHRATCAACNQACQVPFKPNGSRPVYCSNCFGREEDRGAKSYNQDKPSFKPSFERPAANYAENKGIEKLKEQLNIVNSKLDILIKALVKTTADEVEDDANEIDDIIVKPAKVAKVITKKSKKVEE